MVVCSGHDAVPACPTLEGLDLFGGKVLHSHDYREAEEFRYQGCNILCGCSVKDILFYIFNMLKPEIYVLIH